MLSKYQKSEPLTINRADLRNAPYNPRKISREAAQRLKSLLKDHGYVGGIVYNRQTGHIVAGHRRIEQLDQLEGSTDYQIRVDAIDVDIHEEMELNVALNNPSCQGSWDIDLLGEVIGELDGAGRSIDRTGMSKNDLFELFGDIVLAGEAAGQRDAESEILDTIDEIKVDGSEARSIRDAEKREEKRVREAEAEAEAEPEPEGEPEEGYDFAGRREEYTQSVQDDEDADIMITLTFNNNRQRQAFQEHFGLDIHERYFDIFAIESSFKWECPV